MKTDTFSTFIWLALVGLTITTWRIGETGLAGKGAMLALLVIALIKGQMVANYFMGVRHAYWGWRALVLVYFILVGGLIAAAYLMGVQ
ncbi:ATP synthase subunit a [Novimethylophilus kurashikiensis]|uniref:ATP synthase subunit a n=1 Tax=Novimethylophilus kurashikiensis TaxID=1825523 RepID=A0A2R5F833_9PROT|nr:cytochrome C oxidase subunit IV family protein [Novimethylophilus kurashikiensis]GBG13063.1 ATP synthase subunit a [Novimethylophilus kurashikiensis]